MSYYARMYGSIDFTSVLEEEVRSKVDCSLKTVFGEAYVRIITPHGPKQTNVPFTSASVYLNGTYNEESLMNALEEVASVAKIDIGEIRCSGEDSSMWRYIYKDGSWVEQAGQVIFDNCLPVAIPGGELRVRPMGTKNDYPGVFVELVRKDMPDEILTVVEYDTARKSVQTCVYMPGKDELQTIIVQTERLEGDA